MFRRTVTKSSQLASMAAVIISKPLSCPSSDLPKGAWHQDGAFVNPWPSFTKLGVMQMAVIAGRDWKSSPIPPKELLPQVIDVDWGIKAGASTAEKQEWKEKIKATWLGHACFLLEFPAPRGSEGRGPRILYDPVFSKRCSPSQYIGPARVTEPPFPLKDLPEVDAVILSHNHYDHTDVTTLKHIYATQTKGSVHFFAPLGNASWFESLGVAKEHMTELDWWHERDLTVTLPGNTSPVTSQLRITCTPCQHFTGRGLLDRFKTLWASWAVQQIPSETSPFSSSVWFAGDTGYRTVPRNCKNEDDLAKCPAFKEIGDKFGGFDFSMIPIGAYEPRAAMSPVHCSPEDSVELHLDTKSKKSIGMHWGTWVLTCEEMTEPPKRLRTAGAARGLTEADFGVCAIGETVLISPSLAQSS